MCAMDLTVRETAMTVIVTNTIGEEGFGAAVSYALEDTCPTRVCGAAGLKDLMRADPATGVAPEIGVVVVDLNVVPGEMGPKKKFWEDLGVVRAARCVVIVVGHTQRDAEEVFPCLLSSGVAHECYSAEEFFAAGRIEEIVRNAIAQYGQRYVAWAVERNAFMILQRVLSWHGGNHGVTSLERLAALMMPFLDISARDKAMLELVVRVCDLGMFPGNASVPLPAALILQGLPGLEPVHRALVDCQKPWPESGAMGRVLAILLYVNAALATQDGLVLRVKIGALVVYLESMRTWSMFDQTFAAEVRTVMRAVLQQKEEKLIGIYEPSH